MTLDDDLQSGRGDTPAQRRGASPDVLCALLGIERPVLLAPMAKVAGGQLASAVSNAGGLGLIGGGYGDADWLDVEIARANGARVGVGVIVWNMADGAIEAILAHRPCAVWLSFGDVEPLIEPIHAAGALVICQVATADEAVGVARAGADVLVAQGTEAGGHGRPTQTTAECVAAISAAVPDVPLVAAGGVNSHADLQTLHQLGAAGAALGTAFYATNEALDAEAAKMRLVEATNDETVRSIVYDHIRGPLWPSGYDGRSLTTTLTSDWAGNEDVLAQDIERLRAAHAQAAASNDMSIRVVWAGSGVGGITSIEGAGEVVARFAPANPNNAEGVANETT